MARYVIDLRSMTGGRGAFSMTFDHYEDMPPQLAQRAVDAHPKAREAAHR